MTKTLIHNGSVYTGVVGAVHTAIAFEDDRIVWTGSEDGAATFEQADEVIDARGALITPAFVDAHLHLVGTGLSLTQLDLSNAPSKAAMLTAVAQFAATYPQGLLVGFGWDETRWTGIRSLPTADELDRAAPGRSIYLSRIDGHSGLCSAALVAALPGLSQLASDQGWTGDGRVEREARFLARNYVAESTTDAERLAAARAACTQLAMRGIVGFHEAAAPHIGPESELTAIGQAADEAGLRATLYWGAFLAAETGLRLGVAGLAGDLNADGALGSRTAALRTDYADAPGHRGHSYLSADQIAEHIICCASAGLQAGFHCIGEAALDAIEEGLRRAAEQVGADTIREGQHRLDHVEMPSRSLIDLMGQLGVHASVQPRFDEFWGGPDQMYAARVGSRWRTMNPLQALDEHAGGLAFGSDSPVTPVSPWETVRAACLHHAPEHALSPARAFRAHTRGGWLAAKETESGHLRVGLRADLAMWRTPGGLSAEGLPVLDSNAPLPTLVRTISSGRTVAITEED